jgi:hypothetical protein
MTDKSFLAGVPSGDATVASRENPVEGRAARNGREIRTFSDETLYRVIEADPVLDLLERAWRDDRSVCPSGVDEKSCPHCLLSNEIEALLKANGRLA